MLYFVSNKWKAIDLNNSVAWHVITCVSELKQTEYLEREN